MSTDRLQHAHINIWMPLEMGGNGTFVNKENQAQIAQLDNDLLNFGTKPFRTGSSPCDSNKDLTQQATIDQMIEPGIDDIEQDEKGGLHQDGVNTGFMIRQGSSHSRHHDRPLFEAIRWSMQGRDALATSATTYYIFVVSTYGPTTPYYYTNSISCGG